MTKIKERIKILEISLQNEINNLQQLEKIKSDTTNKTISIRGGIAELKLLEEVMNEQETQEGEDDEKFRDESK